MARYKSSEQTREALINAAGELAAENGFPNVSMRAIATRAGENVGSIHYHFGSREKLFEAVVRRVLEHIGSQDVEPLLAALEPELDTPLGQARAIRAIVHRELAMTFDDTKPHWYCRALYQLMQFKSPLQDLFLAEYVLPFSSHIHRLLLRIRPGQGEHELHLRTVALLSPLIFHADYIQVIHGILDVDTYSPEYLQQLEDLVTLQTQLSLGLPSDKDAVS